LSKVTKVPRHELSPRPFETYQLRFIDLISTLVLLVEYCSSGEEQN